MSATTPTRLGKRKTPSPTTTTPPQRQRQQPNEATRCILARMPTALRGVILDFGPNHRTRFAPTLVKLVNEYGACDDCGVYRGSGNGDWVICDCLHVLVCPECAVRCEQCDNVCSQQTIEECRPCGKKICMDCQTYCQTCVEFRCKGDHGVEWYIRPNFPRSDCDECR